MLWYCISLCMSMRCANLIAGVNSISWVKQCPVGSRRRNSRPLGFFLCLVSCQQQTTLVLFLEKCSHSRLLSPFFFSFFFFALELSGDDSPKSFLSSFSCQQQTSQILPFKLQRFPPFFWLLWAAIFPAPSCWARPGSGAPDKKKRMQNAWFDLCPAWCFPSRSSVLMRWFSKKHHRSRISWWGSEQLTCPSIWRLSYSVFIYSFI